MRTTNLKRVLLAAAVAATSAISAFPHEGGPVAPAADEERPE